MTQLSTTNGSNAAIIEKVVVTGDLGQLTPQERISYYKATCDSLGLNPLTKPFDYIRLNGKLTLYAKRDATDQMRRIHGVSVAITGRDNIGDVHIVTARATTSDGRSDESTGAVPIANLKGDKLANALMKAETKAKRRVTLSIVGLGMLDETEMDTIPPHVVKPTEVDTATGEIIEPEKVVVIEQEQPASNGKPMPDDELVMSEASAADFFKEAADLIPRYGDKKAIVNAAKKLGYTAVPGKSYERVEMYKSIRDYAAQRDAEDAEKADAPDADELQELAAQNPDSVHADFEPAGPSIEDATSADHAF